MREEVLEQPEAVPLALLRMELGGKDVPVLMAPVGVNSLFHPDKELGVAQACAELRVPFTLSTAAESTFEEIAAAVPESPPIICGMQRERRSCIALQVHHP